MTIPSSVTSIGNHAFSGCKKLASIEMPSSVTSIGNYAFAQCSGLTSIAIPDSVTSIGERAFSTCTSLTSVAIGSGTTSIGETAFYLCSKLEQVSLDSFNVAAAKSMIDGTTNYIFGEVIQNPSTWEYVEKTIRVNCTNGSFYAHFSADYPATITFTDI